MSAWYLRPKRQLKAAGPSFQLNRVSIGTHPGIRGTRPEDIGRKDVTMPTPAMFQGDSVKRLLQGAAVGAVATMIIGFYWGGWVTGGTANDMTQRSTKAAVVAALSPICVDRFQRSAEAAVNLVELKKVASYQQGSFIEKGGWATMPGSDASNSAVAGACANMLSNLK
jgi:hypothetical protein